MSHTIALDLTLLLAGFFTGVVITATALITALKLKNHNAESEYTDR